MDSDFDNRPSKEIAFGGSISFSLDRGWQIGIGVEISIRMHYYRNALYGKLNGKTCPLWTNALSRHASGADACCSSLGACLATPAAAPKHKSSVAQPLSALSTTLP